MDEVFLELARSTDQPISNLDVKYFKMAAALLVMWW
jgi:hypothetical protein